jgi:predicted membrane protein
MEANNTPQNPKMTKKFAFGVVILLAGLTLLAYNFGIITSHWKSIFFSWQMLLIVIGVISLLSRDNWVPGIILISVGGFFLLPKLFFLPDNFVHNFWPLVLIGAGLLIIFRIYPADRFRRRIGGVDHDRTSHEGVIHEEVVFGDSKQRVTSQDFRGGMVHCVFGSIELDLTQAKLAEGTNTLDLSVVFGGITVIVPSDWKVEMKMASVLGGFADKRVYVKEKIDTTRVLIIKGNAVFGGGELKSY